MAPLTVRVVVVACGFCTLTYGASPTLSERSIQPRWTFRRGRFCHQQCLHLGGMFVPSGACRVSSLLTCRVRPFVSFLQLGRSTTPVLALEGHGTTVGGVAWSPHFDRLATYAEEAVFLWSVSPPGTDMGTGAPAYVDVSQLQACR